MPASGPESHASYILTDKSTTILTVPFCSLFVSPSRLRHNTWDNETHPVSTSSNDSTVEDARLWACPVPRHGYPGACDSRRKAPEQQQKQQLLLLLPSQPCLNPDATCVFLLEAAASIHTQVQSGWELCWQDIGRSAQKPIADNFAELASCGTWAQLTCSWYVPG